MTGTVGIGMCHVGPLGGEGGHQGRQRRRKSGAFITNRAKSPTKSMNLLAARDALEENKDVLFIPLETPGLSKICGVKKLRQQE